MSEQTESEQKEPGVTFEGLTALWNELRPEQVRTHVALSEWLGREATSEDYALIDALNARRGPLDIPKSAQLA